MSLPAVGLVLATTAAVAAVAHVLLPRIGWAEAIALGAIVSPPDAVSATAVGKRLGIPRRVVTILEGESLVNDATALRIQARAVWDVLVFVLNGFIFILIGLQLGALRDAVPSGRFGPVLRRSVDQCGRHCGAAGMGPVGGFTAASA